MLIWHRGKVEPERGEDPAFGEMARAGLVLLLLSPNCASSETMTVDMDRALLLQARGESRVIPILVGPFDWERSPLRGLALLPSNREPVCAWSNRGQAWLDVASGIARIRGVLATMSPAPGNRDPQSLAIIAALLSAEVRTNGCMTMPAGAGDGHGVSPEARWETWLFDRCAARDVAAVERVASIVSNKDLALRLQTVAASLGAGLWPKSMEQTLLHLEKTRAGWRADVRFSFLGHICSVEVTHPVRTPIGLGATLEADPREGACTIRLVAKRDSPVRGSRARIWDGVHALTRWLVPTGIDALGSSSENESVLLELESHEEEAK